MSINNRLGSAQDIIDSLIADLEGDKIKLCSCEAKLIYDAGSILYQLEALRLKKQLAANSKRRAAALNGGLLGRALVA